MKKDNGFGKPNLIFVGKIQHEPINTEVENLHLQSCKNSTSLDVNNTPLEVENLHPINTNNINTNITKTNSINPQSEDDGISLIKIKEQCKLNEFEEKDKTILEDVIDTLYNSPTVKIGAVNVDHLKILSKLELITKENLQHLLQILENTPNIKNVTKYLLPCLYNNLGNTNIAINNKPKVAQKHYGRDYSEEFLNSLYANIPKKDFVTS